MPSNSPKMTSMEMSGRMASTDSALPRASFGTVSVIQALKAASLAVEPKKVITQSSTTIMTAAAAVAAAAGNSFAAFSTVTSPNAAVESPHSRYPPQMNSFRLPTRSDSAPIRSVVSVAAAALQPTMAEM